MATIKNLDQAVQTIFEELIASKASSLEQKDFDRFAEIIQEFAASLQLAQRERSLRASLMACTCETMRDLTSLRMKLSVQ